MAIHPFCPISVECEDGTFKATFGRFFHHFLAIVWGRSQFSLCQLIGAYERHWTRCGSHANDGGSLSKVKWCSATQNICYATVGGLAVNNCVMTQVGLSRVVHMYWYLPGEDIQYFMHWQYVNYFVGIIFAVPQICRYWPLKGETPQLKTRGSIQPTFILTKKTIVVIQVCILENLTSFL